MQRKQYLSILPVLLLVLTLALTLGACSKESDASSSSDPESQEEPVDQEYPVTVEGVTIKSRPSSVVSLSPSLTEKLYDLGLFESLVGVSDYCDYPGDAEGLPRCGTAQLPNLEEISDLRPHILLTQAALSEDDLIALQQMDVEVVTIPHAASIAQFKESYISLARLLEGEFTGGEQGERFADNIQDRLDYLNGHLSAYIGENGPKPALYLRLLDFNVATGDTLEHELMEVIGLENIAAQQSGWLYPAEDANAAEGRAAFESVGVIFMDEKFVNIKMLEQSAFYKGLPATLKDWYLYVDSLVMERQSLRTLDILEEMAQYAWPDAWSQGSGAQNDGGEEGDEE